MKKIASIFILLCFTLFSCEKESTPTNSSQNPVVTLSTEKGQYSFPNGALVFDGAKKYTYNTVCNVFRLADGDNLDLGGALQSTGGTAKGFSCKVKLSNKTFEVNKDYDVDLAANSLIFANPLEQDGYVYRGLEQVKLTFLVLSNNQVKGTIKGTFQRFYPAGNSNVLISFDFKK